MVIWRWSVWRSDAVEVKGQVPAQSSLAGRYFERNLERVFCEESRSAGAGTAVKVCGKGFDDRGERADMF